MRIAGSIRAGALLFLLALLSGCSRPAAQPDDSRLRLVSTAPNLTECVFAVGAGDLLVGRTESCDYPPGAVNRIPVVGGFASPFVEPLLAVRPTHVLETVLADPDIRRRLDALRIPVVHVPCTRLDEVPEAVSQLGTLTHHEAEAQRLAAALRAGIDAARAEAASQADRPRTLLLFAPDAPITAGRNAFVSELLRLAGGLNLGDESSVDYYHISLEWLLKRDPDMILCLFEHSTQEPVTLFQTQTGWNALSAVRNNRVYAVTDLDTVCRPGPRLLEGLADLKRVLQRDSGRHAAARAAACRTRSN